MTTLSNGRASVTDHYDQHLGPIYAWMVGGVEAAIDAAGADLQAFEVTDGGGRLAVDLGTGLGAHAVALAAAGYRVVAIDSCEELLRELRARAEGRYSITCVQDDLCRFREYCTEPVDLIACMGDTLTHLPSWKDMQTLLHTVAESLAPGGRFIATFRDYSAPRSDGVAAFIPVRQDDSRILTCVLEYHAQTITVHDIVHQRSDAGWQMRVSSYSKLRLPPEQLRALLVAQGLSVALRPGRNGMIQLAATRAVQR
jgi:SAM-dependent methyltransferase